MSTYLGKIEELQRLGGVGVKSRGQGHGQGASDAPLAALDFGLDVLLAGLLQPALVCKMRVKEREEGGEVGWSGL